MKSTDGIPRGKRMKRSDNPDFVPYKSTFSHGYSLRPEQIAYVKKNGGSKFIRSLIDQHMEDE